MVGIVWRGTRPAPVAGAELHAPALRGGPLGRCVVAMDFPQGSAMRRRSRRDVSRGGRFIRRATTWRPGLNALSRSHPIPLAPHIEIHLPNFREGGRRV